MRINNKLRIRLVYRMRITIETVIFIIRNKMCCNIITKLIHKFDYEL